MKMMNKKVINNLNKFYNSREKMFFDASYEVKQNETEQGRAGLKILTPKQMLQKLPVALGLVKAGNNS